MEKEEFSLNHIRQLAKKMHAAGLHEIELRNERGSLKLRYPERTPPVTAVATTAKRTLTPLCAPMPGKAVLHHPSQTQAYVQPGQAVKHNDLLGLLKVGALYLPLRSPVDGVVVSIEVEQLQPVEYGCSIMLLESADVLSAAL